MSKNKLRADLLGLVMSERQLARQEGNSAAAVVATSKAMDLLLGRYADEAATAQPINALVHRIVHQVVCPMCKERQAITEPPQLDPANLPPERRRSAWDDDPEEEAAMPAPPAPARAAPVVETAKQAILAAVPKVSKTGRRGDPDGKIRGLA